MPSGVLRSQAGVIFHKHRRLAWRVRVDGVQVWRVSVGVERRQSVDVRDATTAGNLSRRRSMQFAKFLVARVGHDDRRWPAF